MMYRDHTIQRSDYGFFIRDSKGKIMAEVESVAEAEKWIDVEKDGYTDFEELD